MYIDYIKLSLIGTATWYRVCKSQKTFERNICNHKTSAIIIIVEWKLLRFICLTGKSCDRIISVQFNFFTLFPFYVEPQ